MAIPKIVITIPALSLIANVTMQAGSSSVFRVNDVKSAFTHGHTTSPAHAALSPSQSSLSRPRDGTVRQVCCGKDFTLLLTESGRCFSWGAGGRGQLGHGDFLDVRCACHSEKYN